MRVFSFIGAVKLFFAKKLTKFCSLQVQSSKVPIAKTRGGGGGGGGQTINGTSQFVLFRLALNLSKGRLPCSE